MTATLRYSIEVNGTRMCSGPGADPDYLAAQMANYQDINPGADVRAVLTFAGCAFTVGQQVEARSAGDHDCVWRFTVIARTARFITLEQDSGEVMRVGVRDVDGEEWASPFGSYSLAPVIRAGR